MGANAQVLKALGPQLELLLPLLDEKARRLVLEAVARAAGIGAIQLRSLDDLREYADQHGIAIPPGRRKPARISLIAQREFRHTAETSYFGTLTYNGKLYLDGKSYLTILTRPQAPRPAQTILLTRP